jgi:type IV pilus assembly protein PilQ
VLKDVPADQVIDIIFQQKGLDMRKNGNVILIAPRDEIATREKLEFEAKQQIGDLEPLKTESFKLNYQKAIDLGKLLAGTATGLGGPAQRILTKRGSVISDATSNIVFVNDIASKLDEIRNLIRQIDVANRQVLIEARVVEANDNFNKNLGMRLNFLTRTTQQIGNSGVNIGGGSFAPPTNTLSYSVGAGGVLTPSGSFTPGQQTTAQTMGVNLPSYTNSGGALAFSLFNASLTNILNLELAALEADGGGKIISSPRVITANNVPAKIEDGTEVPYVIQNCSAGACTNTVSFKSAKLSLETTPQITPEGTVRMKLVVKKEEPDWTRAIAGNPPIKSSTVETDVMVENGGTVVIGGVFRTDNSQSTERVPFFGDLPYVGFLFKYQHKEGTRRELLVFITPKVISEQMAVR